MRKFLIPLAMCIAAMATSTAFGQATEMDAYMAQTECTDAYTECVSESMAFESMKAMTEEVKDAGMAVFQDLMAAGVDPNLLNLGATYWQLGHQQYAAAAAEAWEAVADMLLGEGNHTQGDWCLLAGDYDGAVSAYNLAESQYDAGTDHWLSALVSMYNAKTLFDMAFSEWMTVAEEWNGGGPPAGGGMP